MYIYIYVYVHIHTYTYTHTYIYVCSQHHQVHHLNITNCIKQEEAPSLFTNAEEPPAAPPPVL